MTAIGFLTRFFSKMSTGVEKRSFAWYNRDRQKPKCEKIPSDHSFLRCDDAQKNRKERQIFYFSIFFATDAINHPPRALHG